MLCFHIPAVDPSSSPKNPGEFFQPLKWRWIQNMLEFNKKIMHAWSKSSHILITGPLIENRPLNN